MKKHIFIIVFYFTKSISFGQVNNALSLGGFLSPEYSFLGLPEEKKSLFYPDKTKGKFGFSVGLSLKYRLSKNIFLVSTVGYELKQCTFIKSGLELKPDYDTMLQKYTSVSQQITNYKIQEIDVPVYVSINNRSNEYFINFGVDFAFGIGNQTERKYLFGKGGEAKIIRNNKQQINVGSILGLGYNFQSSAETLASIELLCKVFYKNYGDSYLKEKGQMINLGLKGTWYFKNKSTKHATDKL
ncbi:MAG: outer membrane beta-barrel protein [Chitinophagaceae bacterium]|jgi:hypothetical protein